MLLIGDRLAQTSGGPGTTDQVQLGLGLALPINPGAGFGSILASADVAVDEKIALRTDVGFESVGFNGNNSAGTSHTSRYFAGVGAFIKVPISPTVAFITGRTGAVQFGHFNNLGDSGTGLYTGGRQRIDRGLVRLSRLERRQQRR